MPHWDHTLRLRQAHHHLQELNGHVIKWRDGGHYSVRQNPDPDRPGYTRIEAISEQPPAEPFAVLVAECLGGMRSSLDLLAYELACKHTVPLPPDVAEDSEFPIFGDINKKGQAGTGADMFRDNGRRKIRGIDPTAQAEIERLQPYHARAAFTTHPLWLLHDLDRISKHRLLHPVIASSHGVGIDTRLSINVQIAPGTIEVFRTVTMSQAYMPIASFPFAPVDPSQAMKVYVIPALVIAFDQDVPGVQFEPVVDVLTRIYNFILTDVLPKLEPFL